MTFRQFISARFVERRARRAHKAMFRVYGESWPRNAAGVVDLLTSPSPVYVLDAAMLDQAVRGAVAEALSGSALTEEKGFPAEQIYEAEEPAEETFDVEPTAEVSAEPYERSNGVEAVPLDMSNDDKRRRFVRSFLDEQKVARGGIPTSLRR